MKASAIFLLSLIAESSLRGAVHVGKSIAPHENPVMAKLLDPCLQLKALLGKTRAEFEFHARTAPAARAWQKRARAALRELIGFQDQKRVSLSPRVLGEVDRGWFVRRKVLIRTSVASEMPMYVVIPKDIEGKLPCVLALHGHGYGAKDLVGLWPDGSERYTPDGYQKDFGLEIARREMIVVAPEISCFGERQGDYAHLDSGRRPTTCHNIATFASMLGGSVAGLRVWDGMRAVDYLATMKNANVARLGVMGISGGGMHAFFSACLDARIKAAVISGYFCDWRDSILAINHCICNFVPGILKLGELSDLAGLIAPRPLLVESGTRDDIFPIGAAKRTVRKARRAWEAFGVAKNLQTDYFEGTHQIGGAKAYDFLRENL
jgi:dienelactone hydrolase